MHALKEVCPEVESLGISEIDEKPLKAYQALLGTPNNFGDITKIQSLPEADIWTYICIIRTFTVKIPSAVFIQIIYKR